MFNDVVKERKLTILKKSEKQINFKELEKFLSSSQKEWKKGTKKEEKN